LIYRSSAKPVETAIILVIENIIESANAN